MLRVVAVFLLLTCGVAPAQERQDQIDVSQRGKDRFETGFAKGGRLQLDVRSGDLRISGSDNNRISIHYDGRNGNQIEDVRVRCKKLGNDAEIEIWGGPRNDFQIWIQVPRETDLHVRMPLGMATIKSVHGNKDVEIHAGQLTMQVGDPKDYGRIEASVMMGELNFNALGISKGGLFRSFKKDGPGKYKLYAHVASGQIDLE